MKRLAEGRNAPVNARALVPAIRRYVEEQLLAQRRVRVSEIAQRLGRGASYLNACFKAETGESITAYAQRRRIELAKLLLESPGPLTDVWTELSFYDQPHFNRQFKKATGVTPMEYRKNLGLADKRSA